MLDICKLLFGKAQISTGIKYNNSRNFILTSTYKSCKIFFVVRQAQLAQLVEQRTENPCVAGSTPAGTTICQRLPLGKPKGFFCI